MKLLSFFFLLSLVFFSSCKKEDNTPRTIHPDFQEYVDRFYAEAEKRDICLSRKNLEVVYEDLSELNFCGYGTFSSNNVPAPSVKIDPSSECWGNKNDFAKENLMFHELGHAVLERFHLNTTMPNGSHRSMMCGDGECNNFRVYTAYTETTRDYYLDELFASETPLPKWASTKRSSNTYYEEDFDLLLSKQKNWKHFVSNEADSSFFETHIDSIPLRHSIGLSVESKTKNSSAIAGWQVFINDPEIHEGARIDVKVEALTKDLTGIGALLIVRVMSGDPSDPEMGSYSSTILHGSNQDYERLTTTIGYYPSDVQRIEIYLLIRPNTIGTAYFDNLELIVKE